VYTGKKLAREGSGMRPSFQDVSVILTNERAHTENKRFIDDDLNRQCTSAKLNADTCADVYEARRARELNAMLGPKGSANPAYDAAIDLHTTTTAMGATIIVDEGDWLSINAAAVSAPSRVGQSGPSRVAWRRPRRRHDGRPPLPLRLPPLASPSTCRARWATTPASCSTPGTRRTLDGFVR